MSTSQNNNVLNPNRQMIGNPVYDKENADLLGQLLEENRAMRKEIHDLNVTITALLSAMREDRKKTLNS